MPLTRGLVSKAGRILIQSPAMSDPQPCCDGAEGLFKLLSGGVGVLAGPCVLGLLITLVIVHLVHLVVRC